MESIASLLQNIAKHSDYVAIISVNSEHALGVYFESIKWSNRNKTDDFGSTMYSTVCLCDREVQMRFSPFETFYPRHVQRPITLAVCEICP